MLRYKWYGR